MGRLAPVSVIFLLVATVRDPARSGLCQKWKADAHGQGLLHGFTAQRYLYRRARDSLNRLLKYCPRTRKMTTLRVPHPLPDSK